MITDRAPVSRVSSASARAAASFIASATVVARPVERTAEDVREAKDVVDLVREVRAPGRHDRIRSRCDRVRIRDLRIWIRECEHDRAVRPSSQHLGLHRVRDRHDHEHVGALHRIGERAAARRRGSRTSASLVEVATPVVDHTLGIDEDHVLALDAEQHEEPTHADRGGPAPERPRA